MAIIDMLEQGKHFTKTDQALATFILDHPDEVVHMSAADLASASYTSTGAVTRLCKRVGCHGFKDFILNLTTELERRRIGMDVEADVRLYTGQSSTTTVNNLRRVYEKAVADTSAVISPSALHAAARCVLGATRVITFGVGDSATACDQFANDLLRIGITPVNAMHDDMCLPYAHLAQKDDVGLFVSYTGYWFSEYTHVMDVIRKRQGKVILVSSLDSPAELMSHCDHFLKLPLGENIVVSAGTMFSRVCTQYLLSCLYAVTYSLNSERNEQVREEVVEPWKQGWLSALNPASANRL